MQSQSKQSHLALLVLVPRSDSTGDEALLGSLILSLIVPARKQISEIVSRD
jgi:hypothetical protein